MSAPPSLLYPGSDSLALLAITLRGRVTGLLVAIGFYVLYLEFVANITQTMKQHDLLAQLCVTHPHVFTIQLNIKDKEVTVYAAKSYWTKSYPYENFMRASITDLSKEIIDDFHTTRPV